ncbi:MAG: hypothetical protein SCALA701_02160 [Candidatus Scalindua sp.]|nr:MAG: hypothetical protein SCALA701_02160 [Candidatus Scalindua sp.]
MGFENPIVEILKARRWTTERAAREIYKAFKKEFKLRGTVWTSARFNMVKLGHDETKWLRKILSEFFEINEEDIPRNDKRSKRYRDETGDPMVMSREARKAKGSQKN